MSAIFASAEYAIPVRNLLLIVCIFVVFRRFIDDLILVLYAVISNIIGRFIFT